MQLLETDRLILRPFRMEDLDDLHRLLDLDLRWDEKLLSLKERKQLLEDDIKAAELHPPFGRWSVVLKSTAELVGLFLIRTGWLDAPVRSLFIPASADPAGPHRTLEVYIGYGIASAHRGRGYATEAGRAVMDFAFRELDVWRIIAHTSHANERSARVMQRLGMRTERNPHSNWPGVVGMIDNGPR